MAGTVDRAVTANAAMLKDVMKQLAAGKGLSKDAEAKLSARMAKDAAALNKCGADPAVGNAMKRVADPDRPPGPSPEVLAQVKAPVAADLATYTKGIAGKGELIATIKTSVGTVRCQLLADKAPMTVANFVGLATGKKPWLDPRTSKLQKGKPYYDGTIFHRVIPDFMIQGGDPTGTGTGGPGYEFGDETSPTVKMAPGVLAMANAGPGTNGSQFFITESAPSYLDGKHTIFGTCKPLDVVSKIARVKRGADDKPATAVKMTIKISRGAL
jgi:peptidyl-prolyl cis-trans isomerase A (cyclophilin A)